jgi:hypothetical protein
MKHSIYILSTDGCFRQVCGFSNEVVYPFGFPYGFGRGGRMKPLVPVAVALRGESGMTFGIDRAKISPGRGKQVSNSVRVSAQVRLHLRVSEVRSKLKTTPTIKMSLEPALVHSAKIDESSSLSTRGFRHEGKKMVEARKLLKYMPLWKEPPN